MFGVWRSRTIEQYQNGDKCEQKKHRISVQQEFSQMQIVTKTFINAFMYKSRIEPSNPPNADMHL